MQILSKYEKLLDSTTIEDVALGIFLLDREGYDIGELHNRKMNAETSTITAIQLNAYSVWLEGTSIHVLKSSWGGRFYPEEGEGCFDFRTKENE